MAPKIDPDTSHVVAIEYKSGQLERAEGDRFPPRVLIDYTSVVAHDVMDIDPIAGEAKYRVFSAR